MQNTLNANQIAAFYHDEFVRQQVDHFLKIALPSVEKGKYIVDIGGGCGYFAEAIKNELNIPIRVVDMDPVSIQIAKNKGIEAFVGDALKPKRLNDETVVCFNLILHHLVAKSDAETLSLQMSAISTWSGKNVKIFVNEYIYESWIKNLSGWLIYQITKNKLLSAIGSIVAKAVPSLKANTFGVGVRFRSNCEWRYIFEKCGFEISEELRGENEFISMPRRLLLIKKIRRDSFFLVAK
jgi:hypothetical protein